MIFNLGEAITDIENEYQLIHTRHYKKRTSKLEAFRYEIITLHHAGMSLRKIQIHLKLKHNLTVAKSTISRYLKGVSV